MINTLETSYKGISELEKLYMLLSEMMKLRKTFLEPRVLSAIKADKCMVEVKLSGIFKFSCFETQEVWARGALGKKIIDMLVPLVDDEIEKIKAQVKNLTTQLEEA